MKIADLLERDLSRGIEEIIKVDQADEHSVHAEITEYVATDRIKGQYSDLLRAISEAPAELSEGIGVWISGFFGSGKSSFAKNLGYVLANQTVLGSPSSDLFKAQVNDSRISEFINYINTSIPTEVIMFDVSADRAVKDNTERIAEVMYKVLLRKLDYAEDFDIAELEIELEREGRLADFITKCEEKYEREWRVVRKGAQKVSRASAVLHELDPGTYDTADSWALSIREKPADISVTKFVERAFKLCQTRRPDHALVFIIDEVGQYVARSADKIEDLRAVVEQFGKVGKNLLRKKEIKAPAWIMVTSQEKLDEVVAALDSRRVELAKLQDRFKHRIDLAPADIREVASRRVLAKKEEAVPKLKEMYTAHEGLLKAACRLERTHRKSDVSESDFVQFYPYLPHFIELSIDIMSGIRLQPGAPKQLGGSNRTIIKQAYEMLVSDRTKVADEPIGSLVTLDRIYELVEGNLSSEKQKDITDIMQRFQDDPEDGGMSARVAKAVSLLEFVRDLPRTENNIAACLVERVDAPAPTQEVKKALERLKEAQFVRETEEGWKLQTAQEKNWATERRNHLEPRPVDRNAILKDVLQGIFSDNPRLKTHKVRDLRNFKVGLTVNGNRVGDEGQIPLNVVSADDPEDFNAKVSETRNESRHESHKNDIYWVFALTSEIDDLVANLYASRQMVSKYDQLKAQNKISSQEAECLGAEKSEVLRVQRRLRDKTQDTLQEGTGLFRGVSKDGASLGKTLDEIFKKFFDSVVDDLYPKLEMGAYPLKGNEAEEILKAANLSGLPQVFHESALVVNDEGMYVANPEADLAKEILSHLIREHEYGNKETRMGKALAKHFGGLGYGWDMDLIRMVLAVLFRAGRIDVSSGGEKFASYSEARSRVPFTNNTTFRSALFTPTKEIDLATLKKAVLAYEDITGNSVDMEKAAIANAIKKVAAEEIQELTPVKIKAQDNHLPVVEELQSYSETLIAIDTGTPDDCVQVLVGQGASIKESKDKLRRIREATTDTSLGIVRSGRMAAGEMWPILQSRGEDGDLGEAAEKLESLLGSETFYESLSHISDLSGEISTKYWEVYSALHADRATRYNQAIETIKGKPEWQSLPDEAKDTVLQLLQKRACCEFEQPDPGMVCGNCASTLSQMDSDLEALGGIIAKIYALIAQIISPGQPVERVQLAKFFAGTLESEEAINNAIEGLRNHLLKLVDAKVKIIFE